MTHAEHDDEFKANSALLKQLAALQGECQAKARFYRANGPHALHMQYHTANITISSALLHTGAALMAEREHLAKAGR